MRNSYFLSYRSADARMAGAVRKAIQARGFNVFDPQNIAPGEDFRESIKQMLSDSSAVLIIAEPAKVSDYQLYEVGLADALGKPVFVVGLGEPDPEGVPAEIRDKRFIALSRDSLAAVEKAADQIIGLAGAA